MAAKESSYERVEKMAVDSAGNTQLTDVRAEGHGTGTDTFVRGLSEKELQKELRNSGQLDSRGNVVHSTTRVSSNSSGYIEPGLTRDSNYPTTEYTTTTTRSTSGGGGGGTLGNAVRKVEQTVGSVGSAVGSAVSSGVRKVESGFRGSGRDSSRDREGTTTYSSSSYREGGAGGDTSSYVRDADREGKGTTYSSSSYRESGGRGGTGSSAAYRDNGVTSQRTTITTEARTEGRSRVVPIIAHHQREEHEVIQHTQRRQGETTQIVIPTTTFQSAKMASIRQGVTYTDDKELTIPAPVVAPQIQAHQIFTFGGGTNADIKATTAVQLASEVQVNDMGPEEYARYRAKVEELARQHELETSQKAAVYRDQVEKDAASIRQTLERQHIRDIEFRKEMLEAAVDRQSIEIQLEAEYALRALEHERDAARAALEAARMSTNIDVNIESAVGITHSQGSVTTTSEARSESRTSRGDRVTTDGGRGERITESRREERTSSVTSPTRI